MIRGSRRRRPRTRSSWIATIGRLFGSCRSLPTFSTSGALTSTRNVRRAMSEIEDCNARSSVEHRVDSPAIELHPKRDMSRSTEREWNDRNGRCRPIHDVTGTMILRDQIDLVGREVEIEIDIAQHLESRESLRTRQSAGDCLRRRKDHEVGPSRRSPPRAIEGSLTSRFSLPPAIFVS